MAGYSVRAAGFWLIITHLILDFILLIVAAVNPTSIEAISIAIFGLVVNVFWLVLQTNPLCRWSRVKSADKDESQRSSIPRWALSLIFLFFHFYTVISASVAAEGAILASLGSRVVSSAVATFVCAALFGCFAIVADIVELVMIFFLPAIYDGPENIPNRTVQHNGTVE
jgi:hypothetical protein